MSQPIPAGYHSVTPSFTFKDSRKAIEFYKKALGAEVLDLLPTLDGKGVMHATIRIGNSIMMLGDEMGPSEGCPRSAESMGGSPISLYIYTPNPDQMFQQAVAFGATSVMPMQEMFWGDRAGSLKDPFGYSWMIASHTRDLTQDEIRKGAQEFFATMSEPNGK